MLSKTEVTKDFRKQILGYGLTTAEFVYRRPDRHWLLQTYVWQDYDTFPHFPALGRSVTESQSHSTMLLFLFFWPLFAREALDRSTSAEHVSVITGEPGSWDRLLLA